MIRGQNRNLQALCLALRGSSHEVDWSFIAGWGELLAIARTEKVAPLLYQAFRTAGWPRQMPVAVKKELRRQYFVSVTNDLLLCREIFHILPVLSAQLGSSCAVLLKGIGLSMTLYPNVGLRPMSDTDLLVPRAQLEKAVALVKSLGYRETIPEMGRGLRRRLGHAIFLQGGLYDRVSLDIHWGLVAGESDRRSPSLDWFWQQIEPWVCTGIGERAALVDGMGEIEPGSRVFLQFTPTAQLLYLASHVFLQHAFDPARLIWIYDIHLLIERWGDRIDWEELGQRAREFHWSAALGAALEAAQDGFGTALLPNFQNALGKACGGKALPVTNIETGSSWNRAERLWHELRFLAWPARLHLLVRHIFPSPDYLRWRYQPRPSWLWPLCYPYRWSVIAKEGASALAKLLLKFRPNVCLESPPLQDKRMKRPARILALNHESETHRIPPQSFRE